MSFLKRSSIYLFIILFLVSIYKDLTFGTLSTTKHEETPTHITTDDFTIIKVKVQAGDTVLSITEQLNSTISRTMNVKQIVADFKKLNPNTDPHKLDMNTFYYFPDYNDT